MCLFFFKEIGNKNTFPIFNLETFIVRDDEIDGDRRKRKKHQRSALFADHVLDEAKEIFGVEDLNEFYEDEGYLL